MYNLLMGNFMLLSNNETEVRVPSWVRDHASFLRWATSSDAPEKGKVSYLRDHLWFDFEMETFIHNLIKSMIARHLGRWVEENNLGDYLDDGMLMSRPDLSFSSQPDGMFVSKESWENGQVQLQQNDTSVVLLGTPDMVLEVISKSSTLKDQKEKKALYHEAGVKEYWLVDSRVDKPELQILRHTARSYVPVKAKAGWLPSRVFDAEFHWQVQKANSERRTVKLLVRGK